MLTVEQLKSMLPDTAFATGTGLYSQIYHEPIRWVAIRGKIYDWAIYYHLEDLSTAYVSQHGHKVYMRENVSLLVPCTDDALALYRSN